MPSAALSRNSLGWRESSNRRNSPLSHQLIDQNESNPTTEKASSASPPCPRTSYCPKTPQPHSLPRPLRLQIRLRTGAAPHRTQALALPTGRHHLPIRQALPHDLALTIQLSTQVKNRISALELGRELDVNNNTARLLKHKLPQAIWEPDWAASHAGQCGLMTPTSEASNGSARAAWARTTRRPWWVPM